MALLKLGLIIILALLHAIALIYTLLVWKPNPHTPLIFFSISSTIFMCFCVDLARDELQNIAFYPVTNLIFLSSFTMCCIVSKAKEIRSYWPVVQFFALTYYLLHQQYTIRQILYWLMENSSGMRGLTLTLFGLGSCLVLHLALGTMIRKLLQKERKETYFAEVSEELEEIVQDQSDQSGLRPKPRAQIKRYLQEVEKQKESELIKFFQQNRELPQLIKAVIILLPPLTDFISFIWELISSEQSHTHGHSHEHVYFSDDKLYFKDSTSESVLSMSFFILRIISSAIVFHFFFTIWNQSLAGLNKQKMKEKYQLVMAGFMVAVFRLLAERM